MIAVAAIWLALIVNITFTFLLWRKYMDMKQAAAESMVRMGAAFDAFNSAFKTLPEALQKLHDELKAEQGEPVMVGSMTDAEVAEVLRQTDDKARMVLSAAALIPSYVDNLIETGTVHGDVLTPIDPGEG